MEMNVRQIIELYERERQYQKSCFGEYKNVKSLNLASFLEFIEEYVRKAKQAYCGPWNKQEDMPPWMNTCKEMEEGSAPIEVYAELIKVMTLAGAALETFSDLNPRRWRFDSERDALKWKE